MKGKRFALWGLVVALAACGGDSGTGPAVEDVTYDNVAGSYTGALVGAVNGVAIEALFNITITQNRAQLGGSYSTVGAATDGVTVVGIASGGTLQGTVASGSNPSMSLSFLGGCAPETLTGSYTTATRTITLTGQTTIWDAECSQSVSLPLTLVLRQ